MVQSYPGYLYLGYPKPRLSESTVLELKHINMIVFAICCAAATPSPPPGTCSGFFHRGICLRHSTTSTGTSDIIPAGCTPYRPNVNWTKSDYDTICQRIEGSSACTFVDTDRNGGLCSNFKAILAYESNSLPDVWVNNVTFSWDPATFGTDDCQLVADPPGTIVYACELELTTSPQPPRKS